MDLNKIEKIQKNLESMVRVKEKFENKANKITGRLKDAPRKIQDETEEIVARIWKTRRRLEDLNDIPIECGGVLDSLAKTE